MTPLKLRMVGFFVVLAYAVISSLLLILVSKVSLGVKLVCLPVLLLSVFFSFQRDTYLPFLGNAAFPVSLLKADAAPPGANVEVTLPLDAKDGDRVLYWGAMPGNSVVPNPWDAYGQYENAGIATVKGGKVTLRFHCPTKYQVPYGKTLERHVHFRVCCPKTGMLGRVETANVNC